VTTVRVWTWLSGFLACDNLAAYNFLMLTFIFATRSVLLEHLFGWLLLFSANFVRITAFVMVKLVELQYWHLWSLLAFA